MKTNNKILIIMGVILLNVLVLYMVGQSLLGKTNKYDQALTDARMYSEKELYSKSIEKYDEALGIKDTVEIHLEKISAYQKAIDIGEFTTPNDLFDAVEDMVETYRELPVAYENACEIFLRFGKFEDCAEVLMTSRDLKVTSEKIESYREKVRYMYETDRSMYETVLPYYDGYYVAVADGSYLFLDELAAPSSSMTYTYLSSFSEGYAFAKATHPDGSEKCFIINEEEQRQVYINGIKSSSGVGVAEGEDGEQSLLLSCKVGEKYKYYDINGNVAFGDYAFAGRFRNNVAAVMESEGKWKLIDGTGKAIIEKTFTDVVLNEFDECAPKGIIIANDGNGYHLYNHKGQQIGDFTCEGAKAFVDSYAAFKNDDKWGFVDTEGNVVINPQYDDAKSFSNRMGAVKNGEVWNFINAKGEVVIEESFEDVDYLNSNGICFVKIDGYWSNLEFYYTGE